MNLNQITIPSVDVERSITFYKKLGLRLIVQSETRYARFECPEGDSTFSVHLVDDLPSGIGVTIYFECEDLDERVVVLSELGIHFDQLPQDQPWLWREARLKDPDCNEIILYKAGPNRKNPPWRLNQ